jgi:hypothetical protein
VGVARELGLSGIATDAEYTITKPHIRQGYRDPDQRLIKTCQSRRRSRGSRQTLTTQAYRQNLDAALPK